MLDVRYSTKFKLQQAVDTLRIPAPLPEKNQDHNLTGNYSGYRECHIAPDWLLIYKHTDRKGKIVLSSRGTNRDQELIDYINKLLNFRNNENADRFTSIQSKQANTWHMIQLADVCATFMFYRFEPNQYGFITPCYSIKLEKNWC